MKPDCSHCKDNPNKLCKHCACHKVLCHRLYDSLNKVLLVGKLYLTTRSLRELQKRFIWLCSFLLFKWIILQKGALIYFLVLHVKDECFQLLLLELDYIRAVIKFWVACRLVLQTCSKLVTLWFNSINNGQISPIALRENQAYSAITGVMI